MRLKAYQLLSRAFRLNAFRQASTGSSFTGGREEPKLPPVADDPTVHDVGVGNDGTSARPRLKAIGRALETYLKNAHDYARMMERERVQFELGKRHLANIMGWDAAKDVTQRDIDQAIAYLFPSGLTDKKALPVMKPPEEILPKFNKLEFDEEGRPLDPLFFTLKPRFYGLLSVVGRKALSLVKYHDDQLLQKGDRAVDEGLILTGTSWLSHKEFDEKLGERLSEEMYAQLVIALEHLATLPYAHLERDFIMGYRRALGSAVGLRLFGPQIPEVKLDAESKRRYAVVSTGVKRTKVEAKVSDAGKGKYTVDGQHYDEFRFILAREILLAPLIVADKLGKVDVEAQVLEGPGGSTVIPRAVRHAVALGVAALYPETAEKLRLAGLLTADPRRKERKKVNQPGARAKYIWKRR